MTIKITYCADTTAADWLVRSGTPPMQLITFGPPDFEAYARLRFIPDPPGPGRDEADVELPGDHPSDFEQTRRALRLLASFTATPRECYLCLWEGYSDLPLPSDGGRGPWVELPHRRYALLRGSLDDIDAWETEIGGRPCIPPPAFVWPADHRWCFTSDVDPHWAGIGAERAAVDALIGDPRLDVVPADPAESHPRYG